LAGGKVSSFTTSSESVLLSRDYAIENGAYEMTFTPKGAPKPIHDTGKYLTVWKRQTDGTWRMIRDINNTDLPMK
jgi:ketosteroid isomerase-like protein